MVMRSSSLILADSPNVSLENLITEKVVYDEIEKSRSEKQSKVTVNGERTITIVTGSGSIDMPSGNSISIYLLDYAIKKITDSNNHSSKTLLEGLESKQTHIRYAADYLLRIKTGKNTKYNPYRPLADKKVIAAIAEWRKIIKELPVSVP